MSGQAVVTREWLFIFFSNIQIEGCQMILAGGRCKTSEGHNLQTQSTVKLCNACHSMQKVPKFLQVQKVTREMYEREIHQILLDAKTADFAQTVSGLQDAEG